MKFQNINLMSLWKCINVIVLYFFVVLSVFCKPTWLTTSVFVLVHCTCLLETLNINTHNGISSPQSHPSSACLSLLNVFQNDNIHVRLINRQFAIFHCSTFPFFISPASTPAFLKASLSTTDGDELLFACLVEVLIHLCGQGLMCYDAMLKTLHQFSL